MIEDHHLEDVAELVNQVVWHRHKLKMVWFSINVKDGRLSHARTHNFDDGDQSSEEVKHELSEEAQ